MGACGSKANAELSRLRAMDRKVGKKMKEKQLGEFARKTVLLLGPGESGKSTFLKQMIINHKGGFAESDKMLAVGQIRGNVLEGIRDLVSWAKSEAQSNRGQDLAPASAAHANYILSLESLAEWTDVPAITAAVRALWADEAVQTAWKNRTKIPGINATLDHFIGKLDEIAKEDYSPTNDDMLFVRSRTTGITREMFKMDEGKLELVDVGGQRNERRKWISLFDGVTAILFLIAISEYDQVLWEDERTNRVREAMDVFNEIVNNPSLKDVPICVFMNKSDLFEEKIKKTSLKTCFSDWDDSKNGDVLEAYKFLELKFKSVCETPDKEITFFPTTATNTKNARELWNEVKMVVLNRSLMESGMDRLSVV